jgi:hypothetical protein
MKNVRREIADRLKFEFGRRDLSFDQISEFDHVFATNIEEAVVFTKHLRG